MKTDSFMQRFHIAFRSFLVALVVLSGVFSSALIVSRPVLADSNCPAGETALSSDNRVCCPTGAAGNANSCLFAKYINPIIALLSVCVGLAVVGAMIYGGIEYIMSAGDPQKAASGKKHITNALIALVAYGLLYAFLQFLVPGGILNGQ